MSQMLYVFPDTNLFIQCKPLGQLDWARFGADRVELIVTRPMIAEIDSHKGKGNGRLAKRARLTSSMFGEALNPSPGFVQVASGSLDVRLSVKAMLKTDPSLAEELSYEERDHQLVGIAMDFAKKHPGQDVRVLTYDNGVIAAASGVGLKCERIPEEWLLPAETDERDKQIAALKLELAKYANADFEPKIEMHLGAGPEEDRHIEYELPRYAPLTDDEVSQLVGILKASILIESDFSAREEKEHIPVALRNLFVGTRTFKPASDEEINVYCEEQYPEWIKECEAYFRSLHEKLNQRTCWPVVQLNLRNVGSRPANSVLVSLTCEGDFALVTPKDGEIGGNDATMSLPPPPIAPRGTWEDRPSAFLEMQKTLDLGRAINFFEVSSLAARNRLLVPPPTVDPNVFHYVGDRHGIPVKAVDLSCRQWRHRVADEVLKFEIRWPTEGVSTLQGALRVEVHATNMTDVATKRFSVRLSFRQDCAFEDATALIDMLKRRPNIRRKPGSE